MEVPEEIADEPPSVKLVYLILEDEQGMMSQQEVANRVEMDVRQTRAALATLDQYGVVEERPNLRDLREKQYVVSSE
ncbi:MarR family transcriptional regulator [Halobacterium sp. KA-6]|uniref:MarR family transcriptional regulator n=1 Tax=Halobacterium sp. KA-6 TaxID=2896368 RepID=UPI001E3D14CD|nr:MarR family transcriptional regulator [Halobacterium sp. KA-6]MCD2204426.1 MarR family transcriptional regulator [Halobacterium sp. KA-6]